MERNTNHPVSLKDFKAFLAGIVLASLILGIFIGNAICQMQMMPLLSEKHKAHGFEQQHSNISVYILEAGQLAELYNYNTAHPTQMISLFDALRQTTQ